MRFGQQCDMLYGHLTAVPGGHVTADYSIPTSLIPEEGSRGAISPSATASVRPAVKAPRSRETGHL